MFFYFYLGGVSLTKRTNMAMNPKDRVSPRCADHSRRFLRNSRKLRRSRFSSEPDHYLQSTPIVPQPISNIRSRALVALGSPDRFINANVDHGFVNNVASKNLWAILRLPKAPNSSAVCHHGIAECDRLRKVLSGERLAWRAVWCLSGDPRRASGSRVSTR